VQVVAGNPIDRGVALMSVFLSGAEWIFGQFGEWMMPAAPAPGSPAEATYQTGYFSGTMQYRTTVHTVRVTPNMPLVETTTENDFSQPFQFHVSADGTISAGDTSATISPDGSFTMVYIDQMLTTMILTGTVSGGIISGTVSGTKTTVTALSSGGTITQTWTHSGSFQAS
jgi:hypothetical protein